MRILASLQGKGTVMNLTQEELGVLKSCNSEKDWNAACDEIKRTRDGAYPPDWWAKVKLSGMMARISARWGSDDRIHMHPLKL